MLTLKGKETTKRNFINPFNNEQPINSSSLYVS